MKGKEWCVVALVVLLGLLAGCSGDEETPTADATTPASPAPGATTAPTEESAAGLQAIVVDTVNDVDADPQAEGQWQDALVDMTIYRDGQVKANEVSTARVGVGESVVRVAPNTIFTLRQPGADTVQLDLDEGQLWVNVEGLDPGEAFQVETPAAVASVRGTRFGVRVEPDGTTIVSTKVGTVTVAAAAYTVTVKAGYETVVVPGNPPGAAASASPEERMRWGMAAGDNLDVVLPVVGTSSAFTYRGHPQGWSCSQGHYFSLGLWDSDQDEHGHAIYDLQAGTAFTVALAADISDIALSPTDDRLAYYDAGDLCVVDLDGSNRVCQEASSDQFHWSPDGEWLLYYRWTEDMANLFKGRPDGSDATQLTNYSGGEMVSNPAWAPDGSGIAYYRHTEHGVPANLWLVGADGSDPHELLQGLRYYDPPAWAPDGTRLAVAGYYDQDSGEGGGLYLVSVDGSAPSVVPGTEEWSCYGPTWAPTEDGWPLFFHGYSGESGGHGNESVSGLWSYTPEGGVVHVDGASWGPAWCPNGTLQAAFGFRSGSKDAPVNEAYFFQVEPDLWP